MAEEDSKSQVGDENMEKEAPESPKPPKTPMKAKAAQKAKASPKAPVKKPKAKAAKAKAKTKVAKGSLKKKPAANKGAKTDKSEDEEPPRKVTPKAKAKAKANLKRPAAAGASSSKGAPDWASGIQLEKEDETGAEGEEEAPKTMDAVVDADDMEVFETDQAKKDRSKDFKFKQLLAQNSLPAWVVKAWNETLKLKTGRVAKQREIVNQVLDRTSSGTLVVNLDKPVLSHIKEQYQETTASVKDKSLSKLLFMGKFHLSESQFAQGLKDQEFFEVEDEQGRKKYSWTQSEHATTHGSSSKWKQEASKELTQKEQEVQDATFDSWKFGFFKPTGNMKALCDASGASTLALMDKDQEMNETYWNKAQPQLRTAIQAFEKLDKDAKKSLQIVGVDNKGDKLYTDLKGIVLEVTQQKECLQHVWNWKELRGGEELTLQNYSEMMAKAGESAHNLQEQLAGVKGQLAARAARVSKK